MSKLPSKQEQGELPQSTDSLGSHFCHRVAVPLPNNLAALEDDENVTSANWKLEVRKLWGQDTVASIYFGDVGLRFRYVSTPAGCRSRLVENLDYTFVNPVDGLLPLADRRGSLLRAATPTRTC